MTASGWLAIGSIVASLVAPGLGSVAVGLAAAGTALAAAAMRGVDRAPVRRSIRRVLPLALGAMLIGLRLVALPGGPTGAATLPDGRGPWTAAVETISPVRDGQQVATLRLVWSDSSAGASPGPIVAATLPRYPAIAPGDRVRIDGTIEAPPDSPYGAYLRRIGVDGSVRSRSLERLSAGTGSPSLEILRRRAGAALAAAIPEREAGLAAGIVIGLRDQVDRDLAADFTTVGASHVDAISGWNIAIVAATVAALAGRLSRRRRSAVLVVAIVAYVVFAGASASVVRAAV